MPYDRDTGQHWLDEDGDCLDTRQDVLAEESVTAVVMALGGCSVVSGQRVDAPDGAV